MDTKRANQLLRNRIKPEYIESKEMVEGDLWRDGKGLIVRKAPDSETKARQEEDFNTQNALAEVVGRRLDGLLGREPIWNWVRRDGGELTEENIKSVKEFSSVFDAFWNERQMLGLMRVNYRNALSTVIDEVRPFIPSGWRDAQGNIAQDTGKSLADALDSLYFERANPENSGVFVEESTQKPYSVYRYEKDGKTFVDFSFSDADGVTHFKTFESEAFDAFLSDVFPTSLARYASVPTGEKRTGEQAIDLGGKLSLFELNLGEPFITDAMKRNQRGISLAKTMKGRNTYTGGFRERHFLGVDKPTKEINDPLNPGRKIKVAAPLAIGPGTATFSQAADIYDRDNKIIGRANASLVVVDPVPTATFTEAKTEDYYSILAAASQVHVLNTDSVSVSGISRKDSRSEHEKKLKKDKVPVDAEGRYIAEFAMAFAAAVTGREKEFEIFRCDFNCIVDAGLPTPEEKEDNRKAYLAGEISLETLRSRNGIEDTEAEDTKIKSEDGYEFNLLAKAAKAYSDAGGSVPLRIFIEALPIEDVRKGQIIDSIVPNKDSGGGE